MRKHSQILTLIFVFLFCLLELNVIAQNQSILELTVKELNGDTIKFKDRLDPNTNYVIETMAFWCEPCIRSINKFNYHKSYWKERFNVEILLIEDDHWDDLMYVEEEMQELGWDLDIVVSNDQYSSVGINSIPKYFFKGAGSDTLQSISSKIEKFLLEKIDSIKFNPILSNDFKQAVLNSDCNELEINKYTVEEDTTINGISYHLVNNVPFRESDQNGNIYRFDFETEEESMHIKFSAALCSEIWLEDLDGDSLLVKILDRYQVDSVLHLVTDQNIKNDCSEETIPFEFIQNIGTNAGLDFNIENDQIMSRLICHERANEMIYVDDQLGGMCQTLSSKTLSIEHLNIQISPNPTSAEFTIRLNFDGDKKIELYSFDGQKLLTQNTNQSALKILFPDEVQSSIYFVKITTQFGVMSKKVLRVLD